MAGWLTKALSRASLRHALRSPLRQCSTAATTDSSYHPRRAMMYVPGNDERKILKVPTVDVDCVVLDCEDGVALNRKEEARNTIKKMLGEVTFGAHTESCVRVNSMASGLSMEDLKVVMEAEKLPTGIMLPKVESVSHLEVFADQLDEALGKREVPEPFRLVIFVESALGMLNLKDICEKGVALSEMASFILDGVVFGSDDYVADIGATRTKDAKEVLAARQMVVMTTKAFGLQAIDMVHIDYKDLKSLQEQCIEGANMGFNGKQVIHPSQVPVVQAAFTPSPEKMTWAQDLIAAFTEHQKEGKGAFTFQGNMIDMPLLRQAQNYVQLQAFLQPTPDTPTPNTAAEASGR